MVFVAFKTGVKVNNFKQPLKFAETAEYNVLPSSPIGYQTPFW